jgi:hypothetical protein
MSFSYQRLAGNLGLRSAVCYPAKLRRLMSTFLTVKNRRQQMFFWTIQITTMSILLIFLVHHLFVFFMTQLTVPKVKDMVYAPAQKYEEIYRKISQNVGRNDSDMNTYTADSADSETEKNTRLNSLSSQTQIQSHSQPQSSMKNELKNFLKDKLKSNSTPSFDEPFSFSNNNGMAFSSF